MSDNDIIVRGEAPATVGHGGMARDLGRYQPRSFSEVVVWADIMAKHGGFLKAIPDNRTEPMDKFEICLVVAEGDEYGLTPIQALREISLFVDKEGRKRTIVGYKVLAARIQADPRTIMFEDETDKDHSTIRAQRRGRSVVEVTTRWEDLTSLDQRRHQSHREDILFGRSVRKLGRRGFADLLMGMYVDDTASARVIDVAAVERTVGREDAVAECEKCGGEAFLRPNHTTGGAYAECSKCRHRQSPPQAVRDAIRGRTEEFVDVEATTLPEATTAGPEGRDATPEEVAAFDAAIVRETQPQDFPDDAGDSAPSDETPKPVEGTVIGPEDAAGESVPLAHPIADDEAEVRKAWTDEILGALRGGMVDRKPNPDHAFALATLGWKEGTRVGAWLKTLDMDALAAVRAEIAAVAV